MFKDITLGQYYPGESVIHRLDPRTKFLGTLAFLISVFVFNSFLGYGVATVFLFSIVALSTVPVRFLIKGLKAILMLLLITCLFNVFLTPGEVVFKFWILKATKEGIVLAAKMGIRLVYLVTGSTIMTLTTTPNQLTNAMEDLMAPLQALKVPVHEIAMMMSIALRFIPILMEETDKIRSAQIARGADFESGGVFRKVKSMIPLLVPLFISAFRRANDLAMAMEARCYHGGEERTRMKPLQYTRLDFIAYGILALYLAIAVLFRFAEI